MADNEKDRRLDALLDSFLSVYSAAEPRPGLEIRIRAALRAQGQRQQRWMILLAASAAVVVLAVVITTAHTSQPTVAGNVTGGTTSVDRGAGIQATSPEPPAKSTYRRANHQATARKNTSSEILQVANAMPRADNVIFEREKLYLSPEPQQAAEPEAPAQTSTPSIAIKDLGVQAIEISDLSSVKSADPKGSL